MLNRVELRPHEWKSRTGLDIHESYGMTESASMVTYNHYYRHVVGSVGTPVNLFEVQIRDFDGIMLETGNRGEICICGPNITQGYLKDMIITGGDQIISQGAPGGV